MGLRGKLMNSLCILFTDNNMHYLGLYICMEWAWWNIKKLFYYILRLFYCGVVQKVKWEIWLKPFILILISFLCTWLKYFLLVQLPWSSLLRICEIVDQTSWLVEVLILLPFYAWFPTQQPKGLPLLSHACCLGRKRNPCDNVSVWGWDFTIIKDYIHNSPVSQQIFF